MKAKKGTFRFSLCNPPRCHCPDVLYEDGLITITDDYGGKVKLTMNDLDDIVDRTTNLLENVVEDIELREEQQKEALEAKKQEILNKMEKGE